MSEIETCTIWVCQCCMLVTANGECCDNDQHDGFEPLSLSGLDNMVPGLIYSEHDDNCLLHPSTIPVHVRSDYECYCEKKDFSWSSCEGCGSSLGGERHAMTLFINERVPSVN